MTDREALGRRVREIWVAWASEQLHAKPSWLEGWEHLDDGQREVDMRIGEGIAAAERERIAAFERLSAAYHALYDIWWNRSATVETDLPGYNGISYGDTNAMDEAAAAIGELLAAVGSE